MFRFSNRPSWFPAVPLVIISLILVASAGCQASAPSVAAPSLPPPAPASTVSAPPSSTPPPVPALSAQDIIKNETTAQTKLTSYKYAINMVINTSASVSGKEQSSKITISGTGANNLSAQEMQMNAGMDIESPNQGKMSLPMTFYLVNGWQYIKISVPIVGDQWTKSKMDMNSYDARDDAQHASEMLQSAAGVTLIGTEDVEGNSCYVLQINPDPAIFAQWLKSMRQAANFQNSQPADLDLSKFVKNLTVQLWIAKDSYFLKKSNIQANANLNAADLGSSAQPADYLNMDISQALTLSQYNQPISITLPPESQSAQDVSVKASPTSPVRLPSSPTATPPPVPVLTPPPVPVLTPPPLTTPVPPAGMTTYVDSVHRWTVAYPGSNWLPDNSNPTRVTFLPTDHSSGFYVNWLGTVRSTSLNDFVDSQIAAMQQSDIKNAVTRKIVSRDPVSLPNNLSAVDVHWEMTNNKGRFIFIFMGDHAFIIDAECYIALWPSLSPTFDKMIKSFSAQ